jgi:hypothetical protein
MCWEILLFYSLVTPNPHWFRLRDLTCPTLGCGNAYANDHVIPTFIGAVFQPLKYRKQGDSAWIDVNG